MSERFTIEVNENRDVRILDNGMDIGQYGACKLLNNLYEENKALKREIEELDEEFYEYTLIMGDR